jgi:hypothetical protein
MNYVLRISLMALIFPVVLQSTHEPLVFKFDKRTEQKSKNCIIKFGTNHCGHLLSVGKNKASNIGDEPSPTMFLSGDPDTVIDGGKVYYGDKYGGSIVVRNGRILVLFPFSYAQVEVTDRDNAYKVLLETEGAKKAVMSRNGTKVVVVESDNYGTPEKINLYELPFEAPKKSWWWLLFCLCCDAGVEGETIFTSNKEVGPLAFNYEGTKLTFAINDILYGTDLDKKKEVYKILQEKNKITSIVALNKQVIYGTNKPSVTIANIVNGNVMAHLHGNTFPIKKLVVGTSGDYGQIIASLGQDRQWDPQKFRHKTNSEICIWNNMLLELNDHLRRRKILDNQEIKNFADFSFSCK